MACCGQAIARFSFFFILVFKADSVPIFGDAFFQLF
jgi:hypothetical protein